MRTRYEWISNRHLARRRAALRPEPASPPGRSAVAGFTLVEMTLVMVLIGVFSMLAYPRYANFVSRQQLDAVVRRISTDLVSAQRRAKQTGAAVTVRFEVADGRYRFLGVSDPDHPAAEYTVRVTDDPYAATLISANFGGQSDVVFDAYGSPQQGGAVVVQVGDRQETITVDAGDLVLKPRRKGTPPESQ